MQRIGKTVFKGLGQRSFVTRRQCRINDRCHLNDSGQVVCIKDRDRAASKVIRAMNSFWVTVPNSPWCCQEF